MDGMLKEFYANQKIKEENEMPTFIEALFMTGGGWVAILGILALFAVIFKWFGELGQSKAIVVGIISVIVAVGGLWNAGIPQMLGIGSTLAIVTPQAVIPEQQVETPSPIKDLVQDALPDAPTRSGECKFVQNTHALKTAVRNAENMSSLGYLAVPVAAESGGNTLATGTTTAGDSLGYTSLNVKPCSLGSIYILGDNAVGTSSGRMVFDAFETESEYQILGAASDVLALQAYDIQGNTRSNGNSSGNGGASSGTGGTNYFVSGAGSTDGNAYYLNTTLETGGSIKGQIGLDVNGTSTVYGNYGTTIVNPETGEYDKVEPATDGVIASFDSVDGAIFSSSSFTFTQIDDVGLEVVACPASITANRNADKCWKMRTLKASDGEILTKFQLTADSGNPTVSGDHPKLCFDDKQYFRGSDGKVKYDFFSSGGTNQGVAGICLTFVVN